MNNPWLKVLVFSLLFGAVGFLLGRQCGARCGRDRGHCERAAACHGENACGGDAKACASLCRGNCDGSGGGKCSGDMKTCCKGMGHGNAEDEAQAAVDRIKASGFQGDTTVKITGGHVNIGLHGDEVKVMIELTDSVRKEATERTVEVHAH